MALKELRLQLRALAYNLGVFLQDTYLPEETTEWSLIKLQTRLTKTGARVIHHSRVITFQLADVAGGGTPFSRILAAIQQLCANGSNMAVSAAKPEGNRLDSSAQWEADTSQIRIEPTTEAVNQVHFALPMPKPQYKVFKCPGYCAKWLRYEATDDLFGGCRLKGSLNHGSVLISFGVRSYLEQIGILI